MAVAITTTAKRNYTPQARPIADYHRPTPTTEQQSLLVTVTKIAIAGLIIRLVELGAHLLGLHPGAGMVRGDLVLEERRLCNLQDGPIPLLTYWRLHLAA